MSETFDDQFSRLELMADGDPTWDLSENDRAAIRAVLAEVGRLQAIVNFLHGQFQMHSPKMGGQHSWRFMTGWPWTHARGPTIEVAIRTAMAKVERSKREAAEAAGEET